MKQKVYGARMLFILKNEKHFLTKMREKPCFEIFPS
jgi:hypothetical protein